MRLAVLVVTIASCGDNLHPVQARDAAPPDQDATPSGCTVSGTKITTRTIVPACSSNTPPPPGCIDGVITLVASPPADPRLFALELHGKIRIVKDEQLVATPFLDLTRENGGPVNGVGVSELGLLGIAFHPQYAANGQLYVFYTTDNPDQLDTMHPYLDVLARYSASSSDPMIGDPTSATVLLAIPDPFSNHNAGMIEFGPDGYLYISTGDGGATAESGSDPFHNAQNPNALLGKILRIDVDHTTTSLPYAIPPDNPFANGGGAPEVYILGLRNPWRWSFDRQTGDMWIADVGLSDWEEVDFLPAGRQAGANLGWSMYEGNSCLMPPCDPTGKVFPVDVRSHVDGWRAIIGGQVYRGNCYPDLRGAYLYTDCGLSELLVGRMQLDDTFSAQTLTDLSTIHGQPASLHADSTGELYETDIYGGIYKIEVAP